MRSFVVMNLRTSWKLSISTFIISNCEGQWVKYRYVIYIILRVNSKEIRIYDNLCIKLFDIFSKLIY